MPCGSSVRTSLCLRDAPKIIITFSSEQEKAHGAAAFAAARCAWGVKGSNGCKPFVPETEVGHPSLMVKIT